MLKRWTKRSIKTLRSPTIEGTVATSGLTMPAFTLGGTVTGTGQEIDAAILDACVAKGTWTASGTWTIPAVTLGGTISGGAQVLSNLGMVYIGDTANAKMTLGLTINTGAYDDEALTLKSSDVAHGVTDRAETDTYAKFAKVAATEGGLWIEGYAEGDMPMFLSAVGTTEDTTKTTGGVGYFVLDAYKANGTSITNPGADANLLCIRDKWTTRFIFDKEGSAHADVEWTTYQAHDDIKLLEELETVLTKTKIDAEAKVLMEKLNDLNIVHFDKNPIEDGKMHAMVNLTRLAMLQTGAIRQLTEKVKATQLR